MARLAVIPLVSAALLAHTALAQDPSRLDKLVGEWTLDVARSKLPTEYAAYTKTEVQVAPNVLRTEIETVTKPGERTQRIVTRTCDGKEHHSEGLPDGETETCGPEPKLIGKRDGKVWTEMEVKFSPDGNVHTVTRKTLNAEGKWVESNAVFERKR